MKKLLWILTMASSTFGAIVFMLGIVSANGAPQQAAAGAVGLAFAAIPYCLARAYSELRGNK